MKRGRDPLLAQSGYRKRNQETTEIKEYENRDQK